MEDVYEPRRRFSPGALILNLLTLIVLLAAIGAGLVLGAVFLNPYLPFNPYPPPTLPPTLGYPTATNTPARFLPATWTATITPTSPATETLTPTITPTETLTPTLGTPDQTPGQVSYTFRADAPVAMPNSFVNSEGCNWMGVGGQVFDANEAPVVLQGVHLEGELGGARVEMDTLTGSATVLGPSGYIFDLADHPIASNGTIEVVLVDQSGLPLSDPIRVTTYDTCDENFILLIWRQVAE
jgi:type VI secretion system secreted protein VgrG